MDCESEQIIDLQYCIYPGIVHKSHSDFGSSQPVLRSIMLTAILWRLQEIGAPKACLGSCEFVVPARNPRYLQLYGSTWGTTLLVLLPCIVFGRFYTHYNVRWVRTGASSVFLHPGFLYQVFMAPGRYEES